MAIPHGDPVTPPHGPPRPDLVRRGDHLHDEQLIKAHIAGDSQELLALYMGTPDGVIMLCEFPKRWATPLLIYTKSMELSPSLGV
jgi:hypothetical protein